MSSSLESAAPDQQVPFQRPDDRVGDQAEDRVDREAEEHDVGAVRGLRLVDEVPEAALRVDLLRHHVNDPDGDQREAQADEEARQRAGEDHSSHQAKAGEPERLPRLHQLHVHAADRGERVQAPRRSA